MSITHACRLCKRVYTRKVRLGANNVKMNQVCFEEVTQYIEFALQPPRGMAHLAFQAWIPPPTPLQLIEQMQDRYQVG